MREPGEAHWRIADGVAWTTTDTGIVVLDLHSPAARPMALEQSAAFVWEEISDSGPITASALVASAATIYEVAEDAIRDDILGLLGQLHHRRLVTM